MFSPKMYHLKLTMSSCWTYLTLCFSRCNSSQLMSGMLRFKFIWGFVFRHYIFTKGQYHTRIQLQNVCDSPLQVSLFSKNHREMCDQFTVLPLDLPCVPDNILDYHLYILLGKLQGWTCSIQFSCPGPHSMGLISCHLLCAPLNNTLQCGRCHFLSQQYAAGLLLSYLQQRV